MITNDKNLNNIVINISLSGMKNFGLVNKNLNKHQLIKSFIVGVLWTMWIYLWFFHRSFTYGAFFFGRWEHIFPFHYFISAFTLYSILYLPQNCHSNKISFRYLFKICLLQLINVYALYGVFAIFNNTNINSPFTIPLLILILFFNFIMVWKAKYSQLKFWEKFKSTITLSVKNELVIKYDKIKLFIFVIFGVFLLNLSGFFFDDDLIYIIFTMTQIVFSVGYWLSVSENRKWIDRFIDFLAIVSLNFINLIFKFELFSYLKYDIRGDWIFWILALLIEIFQVYIYYSFSSRTYIADFALNLHKKPDNFIESSEKPIKKEQIYCPKCGSVIEKLDSSIHKENSPIFCPFCGEKIMRYDLLDISEAELLIKHQKVLEQLDHKSEPRSYLP